MEVGEAGALVEHGGVKKRVRLDLLAEPVEVGDYLLIHTGFAIQRIPPGEAEETLRLFDELLQASIDDGTPLSGSGQS
jgi:hydrogenase expression/formation protein HypC